jgi:hypothetical protein
MFDFVSSIGKELRKKENNSCDRAYSWTPVDFTVEHYDRFHVAVDYCIDLLTTRTQEIWYLLV